MPATDRSEPEQVVTYIYTGIIFGGPIDGVAINPTKSCGKSILLFLTGPFRAALRG